MVEILRRPDVSNPIGRTQIRIFLRAAKTPNRTAVRTREQ